MGAVEMVFHSDGPEYSMVSETELLPLPVVPPPAFARAVPPPIPVSAAPPPAAPAATGSQNCKFHPKTLGRFLCKTCNLYFCELCVTSRAVGGAQHKFCRRCGAECAPVKVQIAKLSTVPKGFFARIPGAFSYPLRGSGVLALIVGTMLFAVLKFAGGMGGLSLAMFFQLRSGMPWSWWGLMMQVLVLGYLFAYLQSIIHSTAVEDMEMPSLPSMANFWEDILLPCFQLVGLTLICFAPAIVVGWFVISSEQSSLGPLLLGTIALGAVYFPMAFLGAALLDSVAAANPLQVVPSILKVPLEYLTTLILLAAVLGLRTLGDPLINMVLPRGIATHNMAKLFAYLAAQAFWGLTSLYLLVVGMHILGLLYVSKKQKLGWLER